MAFDLLPSVRAAKRTLCIYAEQLGLDPFPFLAEFDTCASVPAPEPLAATADSPRRRPFLDRESAPLVVLLAPALVAVAVIMLVDRVDWSGGAPEATSPAVVKRAAQPATAPSAAVVARPVVAARVEDAVNQVRPNPPVTPRLARLGVTASRGDSWLVVRSGSANGPVVFEGVLKQGRFFDVARPRLWIRVGAASNLDLRVNGARPVSDLFGTVDAVVGPAGLRKVPPVS